MVLFDLKKLLCIYTMTLLWTDFLAIDESGKGSYPGLRHPPTRGMYAGKLYATMGNYWYKPTCGIFLRRRGEVLRDPEG